MMCMNFVLCTQATHPANIKIVIHLNRKKFAEFCLFTGKSTQSQFEIDQQLVDMIFKITKRSWWFESFVPNMKWIKGKML